jgi:hypothetical protein
VKSTKILPRPYGAPPERGPRIIVPDLRKLAEGRACKVRVPGCDGGGLTTVLAHYRLAGLSGVSMKAPDLCGADACGPCHAAVGDRGLDLAEGILRTLAERWAEGYRLVKVL